MPVRRGAGRRQSTDAPAAAAAVIDDDVLAERRSEFLPDDAREYVGRAAGREWYDDADWFVGIGGVTASRRERECRRRHPLHSN